MKKFQFEMNRGIGDLVQEYRISSTAGSELRLMKIIIVFTNHNFDDSGEG